MHRDHRNCGQAAIDALYPYSRISEYHPELKMPFTVKSLLLADPQEQNAEVDFTSVLDLKREMLLCHKSQWDKKVVSSLLEDEHVGNRYCERYAYYEFEW